MPRTTELTRRDLARAFSLMNDLSGEKDVGSFARRVVSGLPDLVGSELTTLSVCDLEAGTRHVLGYPDDAISPADAAAFDRHIHEHPLVRFHSRHPFGGARKISDSLSLPAFRDLAVHQEYYRRLGIDYVMAVPLIASRRLVVSFVLNRALRDFGERERRLLELLRPSLANLYRGTIARQQVAAMVSCLRELASPASCSVVMVDDEGSITRLTEDAAARLAAVFPGNAVRIGDRLPRVLDQWLKAQCLAPVRGTVPAMLQPLCLACGGGAIRITLSSDELGGERVLLIRDQPRKPSPDRVGSLTPREREVLAWVAAGKTNADVARILGTRERTVHKHLERIYVKLGVESRTAAVSRAYMPEGWYPRLGSPAQP